MKALRQKVEEMEKEKEKEKEKPLPKAKPKPALQHPVPRAAAPSTKMESAATPTDVSHGLNLRLP